MSTITVVSLFPSWIRANPVPRWSVVNVASDSGYVVPSVKEVRNNGFEKTYELSAALRPGLPVGKWAT